MLSAAIKNLQSAGEGAGRDAKLGESVYTHEKEVLTIDDNDYQY
jgi:hypothetical protein